MNNDDLVNILCRNNTITSARVEAAFRAVQRPDFVPEHSRRVALYDEPIHIGEEQTISQPSTVAFMLELLGAQSGERILDIGSGSGWTTALLGHIVGPSGNVLGLERIDALVAFGQHNLAKYHMPHATITRAQAELGAPYERPFDRILVSASARTFPQELISQLREGGTLVTPVRDAIWKATRIEHQPVIEKYKGYIFVPLISE